MLALHSAWKVLPLGWFFLTIQLSAKWYYLKESSKAKVVPDIITLIKSLSVETHCLFFPGSMLLSEMMLSVCILSSQPECKLHKDKDFIRWTTASPALSTY